MTISEEKSVGVWLVVEDEPLVAMLLEDAMAEIGLATAGPANRVSSALQMIEERHPCGAILDVNLGGEQVYPVASELLSLGVPFLFLTGYGEGAIKAGFENIPVVKKPFTVEQIQSAVRQLRL